MPSHPDRVRRSYSEVDIWEWWALPLFDWYVRIDFRNNHWLVVYNGKIVVNEIFT